MCRIAKKIANNSPSKVPYLDSSGVLFFGNHVNVGVLSIIICCRRSPAVTCRASDF